jgi:hypothetical protein
MKRSMSFLLSLAALLLGVLLVPQAARAQTSSNCPTEPATNVPIALGEVFEGTNCNVYTDGDIDSFVFNGTSGNTYELAAALNGASENICLTLINPSKVQVFNNCTGFQYGYYSVATSQKLTSGGTYTLEITELSSGKQNYAVSLQRLFPFPSYATAVPKFDDPLAGIVEQLTDTNLFTFPAATTGEYRVTATLPSSPSHDICGTVYFSNSSSGTTACTGFAYGYYDFQIDYTPTQAQAGPNMVAIQVNGNDGTQTYTLEVSCVAGNCPEPPPIKPPACTLSDALSYDATNSTLTMKFTVGNNEGTTATWGAWLTYQPDVIKSVVSESFPVTNPPKPITKTKSGLPKEGTVGVLSTLTTPKDGIVCSSWEQIDTGAGP